MIAARIPWLNIRNWGLHFFAGAVDVLATIGGAVAVWGIIR